MLEERQAFLEDTDENKLSLSSPYEQVDGAMQQARPLWVFKFNLINFL